MRIPGWCCTFNGEVQARSVVICASYCVLSSACVLHNKFLLSGPFPHENALLLFQNLFCIASLLIFSSTSIVSCISAGRLSPLVLRPFSPWDFYGGDWLIALTYAGNVLTGIWSLKYLSVPMFSSIKRCNVVAAWLIELGWSRSGTTTAAFPAIATLVLGTWLMSYYDLQFSALGYAFGIFSCVFQSSSFELGKRMVSSGTAVWSVLFLNSIVSSVLQLGFLGATGEARQLLSSSGAHGAPLVHLLVNGVLVMLMNYTVFLNCTVNSPLAHTVTGNLKAVLTVALGVTLFSVPVRPIAGAGILLGLVGGAWFSMVKLRGASACNSSISSSTSSSGTSDRNAGGAHVMAVKPFGLMPASRGMRERCESQASPV